MIMMITHWTCVLDFMSTGLCDACHLRGWAAGCRRSSSCLMVCIHSSILLKFSTSHQICIDVYCVKYHTTHQTWEINNSGCTVENKAYLYVLLLLSSQPSFHYTASRWIWLMGDIFHETGLNVKLYQICHSGTLHEKKKNMRSSLSAGSETFSVNSDVPALPHEWRVGSCSPGLCLWRAADDCPVIYIFQLSEL